MGLSAGVVTVERACAWSPVLGREVIFVCVALSKGIFVESLFKIIIMNVYVNKIYV